MNRYFLASMLISWGLALSGCNTTDAEHDNDEKSKSEQDCYAGCVAKGVTPEDCRSYCGPAGGKGSGGPGAGQGGSGGSAQGMAGTGGSGGDSGGSKGERGLDGRAAKDCVECWNDETRTEGTCAEEATRCRDNLACTQLQWCPLICEQDNCIEGCNEVIPTGVAPLTAIVRCAACGDGPCAEACRDSYLLSYCEQ